MTEPPIRVDFFLLKIPNSLLFVSSSQFTILIVFVTNFYMNYKTIRK